jgi:hypothetical protein
MWHKNYRGFFIKKFFVIPSITSQVQSHKEKQSKQMFDAHFEKHNAHLRRHFIFSKRCIPYTPIMLCKATYTYTKIKKPARIFTEIEIFQKPQKLPKTSHFLSRLHF